jgi:uncharacterized protein (DUF934 family)
MPRRLLRDRRIVVDEWRYPEDDGAPDPGAASIVPYERWFAERESRLARGDRGGVLLEPGQAVERLAEDLPRLELIAIRFPSFSEGRGYSQARLLRERWKFAGELRAVGHVRRDLIFFMARCGFNAFEVPDTELDSIADALQTFSAEYQTANDAGLVSALRHR